MRWHVLLEVVCLYNSILRLMNADLTEIISKLQITIDLVGNVIHFSGLHLGTTPDITIWRRTASEHPTEQNEYGYGDLAYKGLADFFTNFEGLYQGGRITALEQSSIWESALLGVLPGGSPPITALPLHPARSP